MLASTECLESVVITTGPQWSDQVGPVEHSIPRNVLRKRAESHIGPIESPYLERLVVCKDDISLDTMCDSWRQLMISWLTFEFTTGKTHREHCNARGLYAEFFVVYVLNAYVFRESDYFFIRGSIDFDVSNKSSKGGDIILVRELSDGNLKPILLIDVKLARKAKRHYGWNEDLQIPVITLKIDKLTCYLPDGPVNIRVYLDEIIRRAICLDVFSLKSPLYGMSDDGIIMLVRSICSIVRSEMRSARSGLGEKGESLLTEALSVFSRSFEVRSTW